MSDRVYTPVNISTATTTLVKTGPGVLGPVVINTTTAFTTTIYDALTATGTPIAIIAASATGSFRYDCAFKTGLTVVTGGASNITVCIQ